MVKKCKHVKGMWTYFGIAIWCSSSFPCLLVKACWHFCLDFSRKEQINNKTKLQHSQAQVQMSLYHSSENLNQAKLTWDWYFLTYCSCLSFVNHGKKHIPALSEMHPGCFNLFIVALGGMSALLSRDTCFGYKQVSSRAWTTIAVPVGLCIRLIVMCCYFCVALFWAVQPHCPLQENGGNSQTVLPCGAQSFAVFIHA